MSATPALSSQSSQKLIPTVIVPGYFASAQEYSSLAASLQTEGIPVATVPLTTWDWVPTLGGRSVTPILTKIDQTVQAMKQAQGCDRVNLVGHSAGGWIARIYLGDRPYDIHPASPDTVNCWSGFRSVQRLITLGTPHLSQERFTRANLNFVNQTYPGAYYAEVDYVCIAGKALYGERKLGQWLAYSSYELTAGSGNLWGDGITPIEAAHLSGATNLTFDQVRHSPRNPGLWYGSPEILAAWIPYLKSV